MADYSKVTYEYYSETLGRSFVPSAADFEKYTLENVQKVKRLEPLLTELETDGIIKATCLCVEVDYLDALALSSVGDAAISSESVAGHSVNYDTAARTKLAELNAKSTDEKKVEKIKLFCGLNTGVR